MLFWQKAKIRSKSWQTPSPACGGGQENPSARGRKTLPPDPLHFSPARREKIFKSSMVFIFPKI